MKQAAGIILFPACVMLVCCFVYISILKMEAIFSFEARTKDQAGSKQCSLSCLFLAGFSPSLLFDHEDGDDIFLRKVS
jgi:hypothetical protein